MVKDSVNEWGRRDIVQRPKRGVQAHEGRGCPLLPLEPPTPPWVAVGWRDVIHGLGLCKALPVEWVILTMGGGVCDAPISGGPVDHHQLTETCVSHIMRPIHE